MSHKRHRVGLQCVFVVTAAILLLPMRGGSTLSATHLEQGKWVEAAMEAGGNTGDSPAKQDGLAAEPEMVAATQKEFAIGAREARIALKIHAATGPARHRRPGTGAVFLRIENVTCNTVAPNFSAYLNVPAGAVPEDHAELFAGALGMFGLAEASAIRSEHGGSGKGFTLDISRLFHSLEARSDWNPHELSVSFVPQYWDSPVPRVQVGRVSLYLQ